MALLHAYTCTIIVIASTNTKSFIITQVSRFAVANRETGTAKYTTGMMFLVVTYTMNIFI